MKPLLFQFVKSVNIQKRYCIRVLKKYPVRKPIWFPTPPSKIFNIREVLPFDECKEFLEKEYELKQRSLFKYLKTTLKNKTNLEEVLIKLEKEEQAQLLSENDKENEKQKKIREERTLEFKEKEEEDMLVEMSKRVLEIDEENEKLNKLVLEEIERCKTYVTRDNLEEKIEEALENPVSYEFAIDTKGKLYFEENLHPYALKPTAIPES